MVGQGGDEFVLLGAWQIAHVAPFALLVHEACPTVHHVGIDVDGVDRVGNSHGIVPSDQVTDVSRVAFGAVVDEYFVGTQVDASRQEVIFHNGFAQPGVPLFGPIAVESFARSHLFDGLVHGFDDGGAERLRDVTDAETDDFGVSMAHFEGIHALGDVCEQVVLGQFQIVLVDECHCLLLLWCFSLLSIVSGCHLIKAWVVHCTAPDGLWTASGDAVFRGRTATYERSSAVG